MPVCLPAVFPRRGPSIVALFVSAILVTALARAQHPSVSLGPAPDWVIATAPGASQPHDPATQTDGIEYLLIDDQVRTGFGPREQYRRSVYRVVDEKGVRDRSQIEIEFDSTYETVTIHELAVKRGDEESSRLSESSIRVIEREPGFEAQVYDERLSIISILDDVRIDDQIIVAYTRRGDNPVFDGRYAARVGLAWVVPVRRMAHRVLLHKDRRLEVRTHRSSLSPTIVENGDTRELRIDLVDVPALLSESSTPFWFDPYPMVEYGEYLNWAEVARWGAQQFVTPTEFSPRLRETIAALEASADPAARIVSALSFVRDEIRYLSKSLGPGSHRPADPDTVLARRFGDCKDKALLLVTLLQGMGIEARAALVSTGLRQYVTGRLPSPLAFDHVIVRVVHEGRSYWLDPTMLYARGTLDRRTCPRYGSALVLDSSTTELTSIVPSTKDVPLYAVRMEIDATDPGNDVRMNVVTTYSFGTADSMRANLAEHGSAEIEKGNLNFYAPAYPSIRSDGAFEVRDDESRNEVVATERYLIPGFWQPTEDGTQRLGTIEAREIWSLVSIPSVTERTMPLGISHPTNWDVHITLRLDADCSELVPVREKIETDGVRFSCNIEPSATTLELDYKFESLQDSIPPEKALAHVEALDRILETTQYSIHRPLEEAGPEVWRPNWTAFVVTAMSLVVALAGGLALLLYRPAPKADAIHPNEAEARFAGIGGWLILVAITLLVTPISIAVALADFGYVFDLTRWNELTSPSSGAYHALWAPVLLGELFVNVCRGVISVVLIALFFQKRRAFPAVFIVERIVFGLFLIADGLAVQFMPIEEKSLSDPSTWRTLVFIVIWLLYFLNSRRVAATFVR